MENLQIDEFQFGPITLQRPMRLFKGAFAQSKIYGEPFMPDCEFLVRLFTDHRSHQAMIRKSAGGQFKNFENYVRGKHQPSPVTIQVMSQKFGVKPDQLTQLVHGKQDGPLAPKVLKLFSLIENIPYEFTSRTLDTEVHCPCCKNNILDDRDAFWVKQPVAINKAEYEFADRMLSATIGASFLEIALVNLGDKKIDWTNIYTLADQSKYPMSHWLLNVQASYGVSSLAELARKMQLMEYPECHVSYERLKKWSSGADLMPISVAKALCKASGQNHWDLVSFFLARTLTFIIDFLVAAAPVEPKRQVIQKIVDDRFVNLGNNLRIAWAKGSKELKKESVPFEDGANAQDTSE